MVDYITSGVESLDKQIDGYPIGDLTVVYGEYNTMLTEWSNIITEENEAYIFSDLRPKKTISKQCDKETRITVGEISDLHDVKEIMDTVDVVIIESNTVSELNMIIDICTVTDTALVVVCNEPSDKLLYTATVTLEVLNEKIGDEMNYQLVLRKHMYNGLDRKSIYKVEYNPYININPSQTV
jgi:hypothetical protein